MKNVECSELKFCFCFYALPPLLQAIFDWAFLSNQVKLMRDDLVVRAFVHCSHLLLPLISLLLTLHSQQEVLLQPIIHSSSTY